MNTTRAKPWRILRHADARPITVAYTTRERRDQAAQRFADLDGRTVLTELWSPDHPQDELNDGWGCDGAVHPSVPAQRWRILRHADADPITVSFDTREERDRAAQTYADTDGQAVYTELWSPDHPQDNLNRGWANDGATSPATTTDRE